MPLMGHVPNPMGQPRFRSRRPRIRDGPIVECWLYLDPAACARRILTPPDVTQRSPPGDADSAGPIASTYYREDVGSMAVRVCAIAAAVALAMSGCAGEHSASGPGGFARGAGR